MWCAAHDFIDCIQYYLAQLVHQNFVFKHYQFRLQFINQYVICIAGQSKSSRYIMIIFNYFSEYNGTMYTCDVVQPEDRYVLIAGIIAAVVLNIVLGLISWWRCYANNYLHWGALATWCLLLVQGCVFYGLRAKRDQEDLIRPTQQLYGFETFICIMS